MITAHCLVTWQLSSGEGLRIQLVRVLKTHQRLGGTRLIFFIWEVLSVCGHVGNEPWRESKQTLGWECQDVYENENKQIVTPKDPKGGTQHVNVQLCNNLEI